MKSAISTASRRGFTLIEVMVSTAIMIVIVLAVVTIASDTFKAYDRAVADLTTQSEARGVLDAMEGDFQSAMIRPDGRCWMEVILPGSTRAAPGATASTSRIGDIQTADQPIIMLFASPPDRPRWAPSTTSPRVALKGDVCAIAYRIGQSSPFDAPGDPLQQVYGVYRTIIDPENTFREAIPLIMTSTAAAPISPWDYWNGTSGTKRSFANYSNYGPTYVPDSRVLIDFIQNPPTGIPCWTLDQSNFIASNVVAMNFTFWCTSSLPDTSAVTGARTDPLKRPAQLLRPVLAETTDTAFKFSPSSGYPAAYDASITARADSNAAPLRWTDNKGVGGAKTPHPYDSFVGRLRIYSDRIYPDALDSKISPTATAMPYLPYTVKAIEVSITVLTPEGSKELRALQKLEGKAQTAQGVLLTNNNSYRRIVNQYGRNYTRYIRLLGNGGG
jgi:type II secretory pathway pseudopilin PulG